jgi:peptidoglycan/xylan/chitin deacetylase (PgdA/CDA1 family)
MPGRIITYLKKIAQLRFLAGSSGATVLYYHGVAERVFDPVVQHLHMPLEDFARQIEYLTKTYTVLSMEEFADLLRKRRLKSSHLVLTFDDGYRNNATVAAPLLKSLGLPFTVFISTEHIACGGRLPGYYLRTSIWCTEKDKIVLPSLGMEIEVRTVEQRLDAIQVLGEKLRDLPEVPLNTFLTELRSHISDSRWSELNEIYSSGAIMNWDDIQTLRALGATIGAHCHTHSILHPNQTRSEVEHQVSTSQRLIEEHLGKCRYFSYPHGTVRDISPSAYAAVRDHYELAFSAVTAPIRGTTDPYLIPRIGTPADLDVLSWVLASARFGGRKHRKWTRELAAQAAGLPPMVLNNS